MTTGRARAERREVARHQIFARVLEVGADRRPAGERTGAIEIDVVEVVVGAARADHDDVGFWIGGIGEEDVPSAISSKPASCDQLKTGHFVRSGTAVDYFELESFGKLAA